MSWSEFLNRLLESTHKVDKAAVFNTSGQPLVTTEDLEVTEVDGRAILCCLKDPAHSLTRIALDGTEFWCFQGNDVALVGMAVGKPGLVLVARLTDEALVVVMGRSGGHGSFLFEVQQNLMDRKRRQMAPQGPVANSTGERSQQAMQQKRVSRPSSSGVCQDQVLVQFHD